MPSSDGTHWSFFNHLLCLLLGLAVNGGHLLVVSCLLCLLPGLAVNVGHLLVIGSPFLLCLDAFGL